METQYISLNMTPTGVNPCFHISQYDVGRMLGFIVHSGGATVDLDTYTCTIEATRSDGTAITSAVATTDNIGTFEVTPTMSNKADKYRCQLVIVDENSKRVASLPFDMEVTKAAMDENAESIEEDASLYQQYTEAVQGAIAEANADIQAEENARIAAVSAEATARQNADATLQNKIDAEATARQTADNTLQGNINSEASTRASADSNLQSQINQIVAPSGEAPSAAEVQNARIGADGVTYDTLGNAIRGQVRDLKSDLIGYTGIEGYVFTSGGYIKTNVNVGSSVTLTPVSATNSYSYVIITCVPGDVFTVTARGGNAPRAWAFIDSSDKLISKANIVAVLDGDILIAPNNAAKLIINHLDEIDRIEHYVFKGRNLQNQIDEAKHDIDKGVFGTGVEDMTVGKVLRFRWDNVDTANIPLPTAALNVNETLTQIVTGLNQSARTEFVDAVGYFNASVLCESADSNTVFEIYARIKKSNGTFAWKMIQGAIPHDEVVTISADLSHYAVYEDAVECAFMIASSNTSGSAVSRSVTLKSNPYVSKYKSLSTFGNAVGEWLENLNNEVTAVTDEVALLSNRSAYYKVTPNGTKYAEQIDNSGNTVLVPVVPTKTVFIGNSLLVGFGFGMCASDDGKDYFALFKSYVDELGSTMLYSKLSGVDWETASTLALKNTWVSQNIDSTLLDDADLVIIQLGDNVKLTQDSFFYDACVNFIRSIRAIVPNARVCWMGSWYAQELMPYAKQACDACGASFIDIRSLVLTENKGHYGQIVDLGSSRMTEYTTITSYTDNGDGTLTFTFEAGGAPYTVTIPFTQVAEDSDTVKIWSQYYVVTKAGVAGHPGDRGFKAIANKMLYELFISDTETVYKLDA